MILFAALETVVELAIHHGETNGRCLSISLKNAFETQRGDDKVCAHALSPSVVKGGSVTDACSKDLSGGHGELREFFRRERALCKRTGGGSRGWNWS